MAKTYLDTVLEERRLKRKDKEDPDATRPGRRPLQGVADRMEKQAPPEASEEEKFNEWLGDNAQSIGTTAGSIAGTGIGAGIGALAGGAGALPGAGIGGSIGAGLGGMIGNFVGGGAADKAAELEKERMEDYLEEEAKMEAFRMLLGGYVPGNLI